MKKLMMVAVVALSFVGCSKESRFESIIREGSKLAGESQERIEKDVTRAMEKFRKASECDQEKAIVMGEARIKCMKINKKYGVNVKKVNNGIID